MRPGGGRNKGSTFERWLAKQFSEWCGGYKINRTPLSGGWGNKAEHGTAGDLVVERRYYKYFPFCVEAKKQEKWTLDDLLHNKKTKLKKWWKQCKGDAERVGKIPLLVMARNFIAPVVALRLRDFDAQHEAEPDPRRVGGGPYMITNAFGSELIMMPLSDFLCAWPAPKREKKHRG